MEYIIDKDGKKVTIKQEDRIEYLKQLSGKIREQLVSNTESLFPDEIEYFISILKLELEHMLKI